MILSPRLFRQSRAVLLSPHAARHILLTPSGSDLLTKLSAPINTFDPSAKRSSETSSSTLAAAGHFLISRRFSCAAFETVRAPSGHRQGTVSIRKRRLHFATEIG